MERWRPVGALYNLGWMGRLESFAKPSVMRVIRDLPVTLSPWFILHAL